MKKKEKEIIELEDFETATETPGEGSISTNMTSTKPVKYKKKRSKGKIVFLVIVILLALLIVYNMIMSAIQGPAATVVQAQAATVGDVQQTFSTSGTIKSAEQVTVYSLVSAPLTSENLELGSMVTAGQELFTYDITDLQRAYRQAGANSGLASLQAQAAKETSDKSQTAVNDYQASINNLEYQKQVAQNRLNEAQANLASLQEQLSPQLIADQAQLDALKIAGSTDVATMTALEESIAQANAQIEAATAAVTAAAQDVTAQQTMLSQVNGLQDTAEQGVMTKNAEKQAQLTQVPAAVAFETARENLGLAQAGVTAPINGVVTSLSVAKGAMATQYGPMCVIESLDKVNVILQLSRYDLETVKVGQPATITSLGKEYTGTVTKIDAMATEKTSTTGITSYVSATVSISNPDNSLVLGIEATVDILTAQANNVVTVPLSVVNTDVDGTYCFVVENGVAKRRTVTTGISSETTTQITDGLQEGDEVILSSQNITDGQTVAIGDATTSQTSGALTFAVG